VTRIGSATDESTMEPTARAIGRDGSWTEITISASGRLT
jgi:hypothetical protein